MAQQPSSLQSPPSSHYTSQAGLAVAFTRLLRPDLDRRQLYALLIRFSQASSALAVQDYVARRAAAGVRSPFTVTPAPVPTVEHFVNTLNYVYTDPQTVEQRLTAALPRLAVQTGRATTVEAVREDPQARAWARETRGDCCYFCAMLASRGAVYKDEHTAGRDANESFTGSGDFKFHNNCHCVAVPVFGTYELPANARQWAADWQRLKEQHGGVSLALWRAHFEGT